MLTFLFWNLKQRPLQATIARLVGVHGIDMVVLAECTIPPDKLLDALNAGARSEFHLTLTQHRRITLYTRFSKQFLVLQAEGRRHVVYHVELPQRRTFVMAAAHLPSKLHHSPHSQDQKVIEFAQGLRAVESTLGHSRTLVVGDFNMNPFEKGMVSASGLHGVMTREIARRGSRTVGQTDYPFLYNPMWGHFGDRSPGPPGTYYYARAEHDVYFWNMFDQVLFRPALLPYFRTEDLEILSSDGATSFLTRRGKPNVAAASDHLPLLFRLDL